MSFKRSLFLVAVMASVAIFTGCQVDITQEPLVANGLEASLNTDINASIAKSNLKMTGNLFEPSDKVGLYMKKAGQDLTVAGAIYQDVNNKEMSFNGQKLISTPSLNYPKSGNVDFIAYYPYTTAVNNDFTIDVDVAGQETGLPEELLYSNNIKAQAPTTSEVTLNFLYAYAKLEVTVRGGENSPLVEADFEDMTASLKELNTKAKFKLADGTFADKEDKQVVKMYKTGFTPTSATFEALILPTVIEDGIVTFEFYANGETYLHRQTTNYQSHSLYKLLFELNFTPPTAILIDTKIFPRDEYEETIPIDASAVKVFIIDVSEFTDWSYMLAGIDGSLMFLNEDLVTGMPTEVYIKPDSNSDESIVFFFNDDGLLDKIIANDFVCLFSNFRDDLFDFAIIRPDNTIDYFYDIEHSMDWDILDELGIKRNFVDLKKVFKITPHVIGLGSCAVTPFFPPAGWSCGVYVVKELSHLAVDLLDLDDVKDDFLHGLIDLTACAGGNISSCVSVLTGSADDEKAKANNTVNSKASTISNANTVLNTPRITTNMQPSYSNATAGSISTVLRVNASVNLPATLTYQWYSNSSNSNSGGTVISGATSASYTIPTSLTAGTYYYFCQVTATGTGSVGTASMRSDAATVSVNEPPVVPKPEREYIDAFGVRQTLPDATNLVDYTTQTTLGSAGATTWVRVEGTRIASGRITVQGNVHLILRDGSHLNATNGGINVSGSNTLTIYAQSTGSSMGKLSANGDNAASGGNALSGGGGNGGNAGIGSDGGTPRHDTSGNSGNSAGNITINGGEITAMGGSGGNGGSGWAGGGGGAGAGIGGGGGGGGAATAGLGSNGKAGGSGGSSGSVIINGGTVLAYWGASGNGGSRNGGNGGGGGGGRGAGIGAGGGGGGGGGYAAGGTGSAGGGGNAGVHIGDGGSGGSGGKGGTVVLVSGTNGGSGGSGGSAGTVSFDSSKRTNNSDHVRIAY